MSITYHYISFVLMALLDSPNVSQPAGRLNASDSQAARLYVTYLILNLHEMLGLVDNSMPLQCCRRGFESLWVKWGFDIFVWYYITCLLHTITYHYHYINYIPLPLHALHSITITCITHHYILLRVLHALHTITCITYYYFWLHVLHSLHTITCNYM